MTTTALMVLGTLRERSRTGYDVQAELTTWGAEDWANIKYGSIYHALKKLHSQGLVTAHEAPGARAGSTRYAITSKGREAFAMSLRELWFTHTPTKDPMQVALTFIDELQPGEIRAALSRRAALLEHQLRELDLARGAKLAAPGVPSHIAENLELSRLHTQAELDWVRGAVERTARGELP